MRIEENAAGGDTVFVQPGDDPAQVPDSHRDLITPAIHDVLIDPVRYFSEIADRSPFDKLSRWIKRLIAVPRWELELGRGSPYDERADWTMTGFRWESDSVAGAMVGVADRCDLSRYPASLAEYYDLVDVVHWSIFGGAGGLQGADDHTSVSTFAHLFDDPASCPNDAFVLGSSGCGDLLIYSANDRGGWLCHENGDIHWIGSIADMINWIYGELLDNKEPEYDYTAWA